MTTNFLGYMSPAEVTNNRNFASYCQQELGIPYPSVPNLAKLGKNIKQIFAAYPDANFFTLCRIVDWAKARNKRYAHPHILVMQLRYAWADGYLPELNPKKQTVDVSLEERITAALANETHPFWRERLMGAEGVKARSKIFQAWQEQHA